MKTTHQPVKSLGQNFLNDPRIQQKIIQAAQLQDQDTVLEIGPGQGAITQFIFSSVNNLICVEKDRSLAETLKQKFLDPRCNVIEGDFLKIDFETLPDDLIVIGNIPYYISTPIIEKIISNRQRIRKAFLTVQLEFGQRLAAKAGGKDYGSLSCFVQYYFDVKVLFKILKGCFKPAPKVDSCFISLIPRKFEVLAKDEEKLFSLIQRSFSHRRKTLVNSLKGVIDSQELLQQLNRMKINPQARAEQLTLLNFIELCNNLVI